MREPTAASSRLRTVIVAVSAGLLLLAATPTRADAQRPASSRGPSGRTPAAEAQAATSVARNQDGRLEIFCFCGGAGLQHAYQLSPAGPWSPFSSMGPTNGDQSPTVIANADGRLEVFVVDFDTYGIEHAWQLWPNGPWSGFIHLAGGGLGGVGSIAATRNGDGRLEVFFATCQWGDFPIHHCDAPGALHHVWQTTPGGQWDQLTFPGAYSLTSVLTAFADATGGLEAVVITGGTMTTWRQVGFSWTTTTSAYPTNNAPRLSVGRNGDGRAEIVASDVTLGVLHAYQMSPGGPWSAWTALVPGGNLDAAVVGANLDGRLEVLYRDFGVGVMHLWQEPGIGWATPAALTADISHAPIAATPDARGRLAAFFADQGGRSMATQAAANTGPWLPIQAL